MSRLVLTIEETHDELTFSGKTYSVVEIRKQNWLEKLLLLLKPNKKFNGKSEFKPEAANIIIPGICVMPFIPTRDVQAELWARDHEASEEGAIQC